ncbi:hypothetical protein [Pseudomonas agarici]|nr:hypothetical protein SAMN05216604_10298 [Pseudomonas agarici]
MQFSDCANDSGIMIADAHSDENAHQIAATETDRQVADQALLPFKVWRMSR